VEEYDLACASSLAPAICVPFPVWHCPPETTILFTTQGWEAELLPSCFGSYRKIAPKLPFWICEGDHLDQGRRFVGNSR
jgi:hypothetical protein